MLVCLPPSLLISPLFESPSSEQDTGEDEREALDPRPESGMPLPWVQELHQPHLPDLLCLSRISEMERLQLWYKATLCLQVQGLGLGRRQQPKFCMQLIMDMKPSVKTHSGRE